RGRDHGRRGDHLRAFRYASGRHAGPRLAAGRPHNMSVARLRLAPVRETMFPSRAPFFSDRLSPRAAEIAACAEENKKGNLPVSPYAPPPAHRPESGRSVTATRSPG